MKILCDRSALQEAVNVVSSVVPAKSTKPILHNLFVRADDDGITLFATDLEMAAKVRIDSVKVTKPGTALLRARETGALLRELVDPTITLECKDQRCTIESGGGKFVLLGEDPEQYPAESKIDEGKAIEMPVAAMLRMVRETVFAAAREETRYAINGVLVDAGSGCVRMVATDGRRLAVSYENIEGKTEFKVVVPLRALNTLARALPEGGKEPVRIEVSGKQALFTCGRIQLVSQLLETRFPDYQGVVPKSAETTVEIQKSLLEGSLRRAAIISANDMRMVRFEVSDQQLRITSDNSAVGRADVSIDCDVKGAGGSINLNPDYILEGLRACELETVRLDMTDDSMPAKFTLGESFTYVVMPISGA